MKPNVSDTVHEPESDKKPTPKVVTIQPKSALKFKKRPLETNQNQNYRNMGPGQGQGQYNPNMGMGVYSPGGNPAMMNGYQPSNMGMYPYQPGMAPSSMRMQMQAPPIVRQPGGSSAHGGPPSIQNFIPDRIPGVPPGLEVLHLTEHLFIRQSVEPAEFLYNVSNKYEVLDTWGRRIFFAVETTSFWDRHGGGGGCCSTNPFQIHVLNFQGHDVLHMRGDPGDGSCDRGPAYIMIGSKQNSSICGSVTETSVFGCTPHFDVKDPKGVTLYKIAGESCSESVEKFNVFEGQGSIAAVPVGKVLIKLAHSCSSSVSSYDITYPPGLTVEMKALLLGAAFMLNYKPTENMDPHPQANQDDGIVE